MMHVSENEILKILAVQSLQQQEEMFGLLEGLQQQLAMGSSSLTSFIENFNILFSTLQVEIKQTDLSLTAQLRKSDITDATRQLLAGRKTMQENIARLLKESMSTACSVKSLLASEMQSLKAGRKALNGYKNVSGRQGSIINRKR